MKLWARVLLGYFLVVGLAGWFVLKVFVEQVKPGVREAVEDVMVDSAHLVAELAAVDLLAAGAKPGDRFAQALADYRRRTVRAPIWGLEKLSLDFRIYVTDAKGIVRFDSDGSAVGQDYSHWRDVALTLKGEYGARSTRADPDDSNSSSLYVAAPVLHNGAIVGVATVVKPVAALQPIIERNQRAVARKGAWLLAATLLIGAAFTLWLTLSFQRLVRYGRALAKGETMAAPSRGRDEIGELARTLASLREEVDGRAYVERYVQHLTHEMKSPLAALRGAGELLVEELPPEDRRRFAGHVVSQAARLESLVERLLRLAQVEQCRSLENSEIIDFPTLLDELRQTFAPQAEQRHITLAFTTAAQAQARGDRFLLAQALAALLENALDFSPAGSAVACRISSAGQQTLIEVIDQGPGFPDYAAERLFERFFSLPRPDGGAKSSGLGLALAKEIAQLHGGSLTVSNRPDANGVIARLSLPAQP